MLHFRMTKRSKYVVELLEDEETGQVLSEAWRKEGDPHWLNYCPHRPALSVWDKNGNLIHTVHCDENGDYIQEVDINPEDGCIDEKTTLQKDGLSKVYRPRSRRIPYDPTEPFEP